MSLPSILFLQHEFDSPFDDSIYIAPRLKQSWEQSGHLVKVIRGVSEKISADVLFTHIDATTVAEEYLEFMDRFPMVINGKVTDISKDRFSTIMLQRTDSYHGPVIVKTKANYGGHQDLHLLHRAGMRPLERDLHERPWRKVETLDPYDYPVFDSINAVPLGVWKNPRLIVEKFVSEKTENGHYVMRNWFFLGGQGFTRTVSSPYHIVKPAGQETIPGRETYLHRLDEPVHPAMQSLRENMGFDYGRFDYVMVDDEPVVFDMNTTPVIVGEGLQLHAKEILEDLPRGLFSFL
jgi:hypothetical protein